VRVCPTVDREDGMTDAPDGIVTRRLVEQPSKDIDGAVAIEREPTVGNGDNRTVRRCDDGVE